MRLWPSALEPDEAERIVDRALEILAGTGMRMEGTRALADLARAGAHVEGSGLVRFPPQLVREALAGCRREILMAGAEPGRDVHLREGGRTHFLPGGCGAFVLDLESGQRRPGALADLRASTVVLDEMPHVDAMYTTVAANDVAPERRDLAELATMLGATSRHVICVGGPPSREDAVRVIDVVSGGRGRFAARPRFSTLCTTASPLAVDGAVLDRHLDTVELGAPLLIYTMPLAGATGPASLMGTVVLGVAEFLGVATLVQTVRPGAPLVFCFGANALDMRHGTVALGSLEGSVMCSAAIAVGHRLGVPVHCPGMATDAKHTGAQAGYEKALKSLTLAAAGADVVTGGIGLLDGGNTLSLAQIVVDDEIAGMVRTMLAPVSVDVGPELAAQIDRVGPGGSYLGEKETRRLVRGYFMPRVAARRPYDQWLAAASTEAEVAAQVVREILAARTGPAPWLSADQARALTALASDA